MKKFAPKKGQIDYTDVRWCPVVNCVLKYKDKILVVKRSNKTPYYPGLWNFIGGFLDDQKSLEKKVIEEIREEAGIAKNEISSIKLGTVYDREAPKYKKTWIVHPVLVNVKTDRVKLDWEADEYRWIKPSELKKLRRVPGADAVIHNLSKRLE